MLPTLLAVLALLVAPREVDAVKLNQIQLLNSHNSYHVAPPKEIAQGLVRFNGRLGEFFDSSLYTNPDLLEQLNTYKVRVFEIDAFPDADPGGKFVFRVGAALFAPLDALDKTPEMVAPGLKVLHQDGIDYGTTCKTLGACLTKLSAWSDSVPDHIPVFVKLEVKDKMIRQWLDTLADGAGALIDTVMAGLAQANSEYPHELPIADEVTTKSVATLLDEVTRVLGDKLYTPDELRGEASTLGAALKQKGADAFWPAVDDMRGKFVILLAGADGQLLELYGPGLTGSPAFTRHYIGSEASDAEPRVPDHAVFLEMDSPGDPFGNIRSFVEQGYMVMARSETKAAAVANDFSLFQQAVDAGAQIIITDFVAPQPAAFGYASGYQMRLPCGAAACDLTVSPSAPLAESDPLPVAAPTGTAGQVQLQSATLNAATTSPPLGVDEVARDAAASASTGLPRALPWALLSIVPLVLMSCF